MPLHRPFLYHLRRTQHHFGLGREGRTLNTIGEKKALYHLSTLQQFLVRSRWLAVFGYPGKFFILFPFWLWVLWWERPYIWSLFLVFLACCCWSAAGHRGHNWYKKSGNSLIMQHNLNDCGFLLDKQLRGKRAEGGNEKNCFLWGFLFLFGKNLGRKSEDHSLYIELTEKKYLLSGHLWNIAFCTSLHTLDTLNP